LFLYFSYLFLPFFLHVLNSSYLFPTFILFFVSLLPYLSPHSLCKQVPCYFMIFHSWVGCPSLPSILFANLTWRWVVCRM
jgi:hypothetical protein